MTLATVAIFSDNPSAFAYCTLLRPYAYTTKLYPLHSQTYPSHPLVLIDFGSKKEIPSVAKLLDTYCDVSIVILVSPFPTDEVFHLFGRTNINLILIKPIDPERLLSYIHNKASVIERAKMLEVKTRVLADVVDVSPMRMGVFTSQGILYYANTHYLKARQLSLHDIDVLHFDIIPNCRVGFQTILDHLSRIASFTVERQEGETWLESTFYRLQDDYIAHVCQDITTTKQREIQLEQSAIFFEQSNEALMIADKMGTIMTVNSAFCRITGFTKDEAIGKTPKILNSGMHDKTFYETMWNTLLTQGEWKGEIWNRRKNGEIYPEWLSISKAQSPKYGEEFFISVFSDISSIKEADRKLYYYANHDPLTGLANRMQFETYLKKMMITATRTNEHFGLFFIDMDRFKEINDTHGHSTGDYVLKHLTKTLAQTIREDDFLSRLGGDEFVILGRNIHTEEQALVFARKLIDAVKEPVNVSGKIFYLTLSIGISLYPEHGHTIDELVRHADAAMYEVKAHGRNGYIVYQHSMEAKLVERLATQNDLKHGIDHDEFVMHYQPIIHLESGDVIGAEALVRWHHPQKGLLYPDSFIHYAQESDFIYEFGWYLIKKIFYDFTTLRHRLNKNTFHIAINITPRQFFDDEFIPMLVSFCEDFGVDPHHVELELLESQMMEHPQIAQERFVQLNALGFSLAMDDFGTGYSSLAYLKNFTMDKLKIDRSFVKDALLDQSDRAIIQAIITTGTIFNMDVQAEGIETHEHEALLRTLGCHTAQGYYYAKPLPLDAFLAWCHERQP